MTRSACWWWSAACPATSAGASCEKIGMHAQDTAELFFNGVECRARTCSGEEGKGFRYLVQQLPQERLSVAVAAQGGRGGGARMDLAILPGA